MFCMVIEIMVVETMVLHEFQFGEKIYSKLKSRKKGKMKMKINEY